MSHVLARNAYGKTRVRVSKIKRTRPRPGSADKHKLDTDPHQFIEASVDVLLEGDFAPAYINGDNRMVVATDTLKNTVYVVAKDDPFHSIESFGLTLAQHFITTYSHVSKATVNLTGHTWHRLLDCPHAFTGSDAQTPTAVVTAQRGQPTTLTAGLDKLMVAKTTANGFENFHRDQYRTLADTDDRVLATVLTATWHYTHPAADLDYDAAREAIRDAMLRRFIDHYSKSVQETLYLMAGSALDACDLIDEVSLTMPNKHHLRFNLELFNRSNDNEVFVATDEPAGHITGTVRRA